MLVTVTRRRRWGFGMKVGLGAEVVSRAEVRFRMGVEFLVEVVFWVDVAFWAEVMLVPMEVRQFLCASTVSGHSLLCHVGMKGSRPCG